MNPVLLATSPDGLTNDDLEDAITTLAASIAAATHQLLVLIAELDSRKQWGWGVRSCAHWLNWKCGIAMGAAREKVRVARALGGLPQIGAAFARGEVSYSKVRAMTRVARPDNEAFLLMIARYGTAAHLERLVRGVRRVERAAAAAQADAVYRARECRWYYDENGCFVLKARLPAELGAVVVEALAAARSDLDRDAGGAGTAPQAGSVSAETSDRDPPADDRYAARRADALHHLAEQFLARGSTVSTAADRHQIVLHVEADDLRADGEGGRAALEDGPAVAPETARRLACDAALVRLTEAAAGEPLDIGRKTRTVPAGLRRFLRHRDGGCRFPGCTCQRYVDAHHIEHWADGGATSASNLVLLCRHHHRLVHEGGFHLVARAGGRLQFYTPGGAPIPEGPIPVAATVELPDLLAARGVHVSAETLVTLWRGERMDLVHAVSAALPREPAYGVTS